jgi:hypothetical protein
MVVFGIEGFCCVLVYALGPVQNQVRLPVVDVVADRCSVSPLQTGPLLVAIGCNGGFGSFRVNGPTILDGQPASEALIVLYTPANRLGITISPLALAVRFVLCGVLPFV